MAIQIRRGNEADLDIARLAPGELAACLDSGKVIVKLSGGNYLTLTDTDAIQEIVAGKAAASHTHAQSDITGLETALAGKADARPYSGETEKKADPAVRGMCSPDQAERQQDIRRERREADIIPSFINGQFQPGIIAPEVQLSMQPGVGLERITVVTVWLPAPLPGESGHGGQGQQKTACRT